MRASEMLLILFSNFDEGFRLCVTMLVGDEGSRSYLIGARDVHRTDEVVTFESILPTC